METPSLLSSASPLDTMAYSQTHTFLKMEDLHTSPAPSFETTESLQTTPPPVIVQSRPAKKRKSWGQELPEPKTTLPPRKRAKTDDEKEQRRIERIKRNRAAAHNSRERKRQETEVLAVALAKANAQLDAYRKLHGPLPASVVLPEVTLSVDCDTPAPSLVESRASIDASSPASPTETLFEPQIDIKQEPLDTSFPSTLPPAFEHPDVKPSLLAPLDLTQHSAVSVEPAHQPPQQPQHSFQSFNFLVDSPLPPPHGRQPADLYQDSAPGDLEPFAFTDGAYDASFNAPLDFSFDDLINDPTSVAVDSGGFGAAI